MGFVFSGKLIKELCSHAVQFYNNKRKCGLPKRIIMHKHTDHVQIRVHWRKISGDYLFGGSFLVFSEILEQFVGIFNVLLLVLYGIVLIRSVQFLYDVSMLCWLWFGIFALYFVHIF